MGFLNSSKSSSSTVNENQDQRLDVSGDHSIGIGAGAVVYGTDAEVVGLQTKLLQGISDNGTDSIKALAGFGAQGLKDMTASVSNMYEKAGSNTATAWEHTVDQSAALFESNIAAARKQSDAAFALATQSVNAANPNQSANDTIFKVAMVIGAALVGWAMFKGK